VWWWWCLFFFSSPERERGTQKHEKTGGGDAEPQHTSHGPREVFLWGAKTKASTQGKKDSRTRKQRREREGKEREAKRKKERVFSLSDLPRT
jgi:hypothetical protein